MIRAKADSDSPSKRRKSSLIVFWADMVIVGCFLFPHAYYGQTHPPSSTSPLPLAPSVTTNWSTILVSARAEDGAPAELSTADIEMKADGKPATVQEVHRMVGAPLRYCLLFDRSTSQRDRFTRQQNEAIDLLSKVVQSGRDTGILVSFNETLRLDAEGANRQDFVNAIAQERSIGGTALYEAVLRSADHMSQSAHDAALRVMFILSDGEDNASGVTPDAAVQALVTAGIRVYAVGPGGTDSRGNQVLKQFAKRTGGKAYFPWSEKDIDIAMADIAKELSSVSSVSYIPSNLKPGERLHKLEVKSSKKGVSITAPDRFYAPQP